MTYPKEQQELILRFSFMRRFSEMALLSQSVDALSLGVGFIQRKFMGIEL